jgi:hypothetical protein
MSSGEYNGTGSERKEPEADILDFCRCDEIARLAERAAPYLKSTALAADRGDALTVVTNCRQVAAVPPRPSRWSRGSARGPRHD